MRYIIAFIVIAAVLSASAVSDAAVRRTPSPTTKPVVVLEVANPVYAFPEDEAAYQTAVDAFVRSGLVVPVFQAEFHATSEPCKGHWGLHVKTSDGLSTVNVCITNERETTQHSSRTNTLLHEVAHAWVDQNVGTDRRQRFMDLRGLTVWEGDGAAWGELGAEHAAEILLWGMSDGADSIHYQIDSSDEANLSAAYELLLGTAGEGDNV